MKFFIGCLLFVYEFISFSRGKLMALHCYFKKVVLTDPNGNVSSTIQPMVIASMHRERAVSEVEARPTRAAIKSTGSSPYYTN